MADPLLRDLTTYDSNSTQWMVCQRWVKQACINAGIIIPMSDPLLSDILVGDTEGTKWAKLQRWLKLLAQNLSGGGAGVTQLIAGANITLSPTTGQGVVTINSSGGGGSGIPSQATFSSAAAGNTLITPPSGNTIAIGTITGAAGTRTFALDVAGRSDGDILILRFNQPAVFGIVEEVHNASAGGTLLYSYTTDGSGTDAFFCELYFKSGAWHQLLNVQPVV